MFSATTDKTKEIKNIFDSIGSLLTEVFLKIEPEKMSITAMDLSHVVLVKVEIMATEFTEYKTDETYNLAINLTDLNKILKRGDNNSTLTFKYDSAEKRLEILFKKESSNKPRTFKIMLIDLDEEVVAWESLKQLEFDNEIVDMFPELDEAIKDAEIFSDALTISLKSNSLIFSTLGHIGDMESVMDNKEYGEQITITKDSTGNFSIEFLKKIVKILPITNSLKISFKTDLPAKFELDVLDSSNITYFLAPRTEDDDGEDNYDDD